MDTYVIDVSNAKNRNDLHDILSESLDLPPYYGRNLDALYDCLSDLLPGHQTLLCLKGFSSLPDEISAYGKRILSVIGLVEAEINSAADSVLLLQYV
ncbi:MAG: barstar family protein [Clostridia bacterium]|nr:barstar family protein [Clostridia bacterium]